MNNTFGTYHPAINMGFFVSVIGLGILMIHPIFLTLGVLGAISYGIITGGRSTVKFMVCILLPIIIIAGIVNPLVNHRGSTVLFYTEYSQITLEATIYGILTGVMIACVMLWFSSYNKVMTSDKFVYLFGRIVPATSLVFTMVMRFIPNFKMQITKINNAQKGLGQDPTTGSIMTRIKNGLRIISIMFTWALENSIESADSMRARGYGITGRSTFSIYRFDRRDAVAAIVLTVATVVVIVGAICGKCSAEFYPEIVLAKFDVYSMAVYVAYAVLCFFPSIIEVKEAIKWQRIQSRT